MKKIKIDFYIMIVIMILVPILMYFAVDQYNLVSSNIDKSIWLSFWGTYIGACIGGLFTYISLVRTIDHYKEEYKKNKASFIKDQENKEKQYKEELDRKLLLEFRPYIVMDEIGLKDKKPTVDMDRYVYSSNESAQEYADLENYDPKYDKTICFKLRNDGLGPAENVRIMYNSSEYKIGGFDDRVVKSYGEDVPQIYYKMSIDISNNDYANIQLNLHFSKAMQTSVYTGIISFMLEYEDIRNNTLMRTMSFDLTNNRFIGCNEQQYVDKNNQALFDGKTYDLEYR